MYGKYPKSFQLFLQLSVEMLSFFEKEHKVCVHQVKNNQCLGPLNVEREKNHLLLKIIISN